MKNLISQQTVKQGGLSVLTVNLGRLDYFSWNTFVRTNHWIINVFSRKMLLYEFLKSVSLIQSLTEFQADKFQEMPTFPCDNLIMSNKLKHLKHAPDIVSADPEVGLRCV